MSPTNVAALASQIGIIQAALNVRFDPDPPTNLAVVNLLCEYLDSHGTTDIRNLRQYNDAQSFFWYDIDSGETYANASSQSTSAFVEVDSEGGGITSVTQVPVGANPGFNSFNVGSFYYGVNLSFTKDGFPVFWSIKTAVVPAWRDFLRGVSFVAGIVIVSAFPALATTIGNAVLGADLATAYPALATGIGNACVSTCLNGGNVQAGVEGALIGGVGGGVGGAVASASDSAIIGQVASAATRAALSGGNIQGAVLQSLAVSGIGSIGSLPSFSGANTMTLGDDTSDDGSGDLTSADLAALNSDAGYGSTGVDTSQISSSDLSALLDSGGYGDALTAPNPAMSPAASPGGVVASSGGLNLTQLAAAALPLITAYVKAGMPGVMTSSATVQAQTNGTLRNANGTTTLMPVGTPYLTSAGVITNNGNGTYSTVAANGTITTQAYPPGTSGAGIANALSNIGTPGLIAIAAVAYLLLK